MNPLAKRFKPRLDDLERQHPGAMVVLLNSTGEYLYASDAARQVLGYAPKEVIGRHALDFAAPEDVPHVQLTLQDAMLNDESVTVRIRVRSKSGALWPVRGSAARLDDPDTGEFFLIGWVERLESDSAAGV